MMTQALSSTYEMRSLIKCKIHNKCEHKMNINSKIPYLLATTKTRRAPAATKTKSCCTKNKVFH